MLVESTSVEVDFQMLTIMWMNMKLYGYLNTINLSVRIHFRYLHLY